MKKALLTLIALTLIASPSFAKDVYEKIDNNTIKTTKTVLVEITSEYSALVERHAEMQKAIDDLTIQYANEIDRMQAVCDDLETQIKEADKLDIVAKPKPVDAVIEEEIEKE